MLMEPSFGKLSKAHLTVKLNRPTMTPKRLHKTFQRSRVVAPYCSLTSGRPCFAPG